MRKLFSFFVAFLLSATLFAAVSYDLNGGVTNDYGWQTKNDIFQACMEDCGITGLPSLDELKTSADPFAIICSKLIDVSGMLNAEKWDWLESYIMQVQNADANAAFLVDGITSAAWRYALAAFFLESQRTSFPKSADFSWEGNEEAFQEAWKHGFANPITPEDEWVLNAPYKEGMTFAGWYATTDFSGDKVTTINAETTGTLYAKWNTKIQCDGLYYKMIDDSKQYTVELAYSFSNYDSLAIISIPETVTYKGITYSVISIGTRAFHKCSSLTSITIPHSVTSIGSSAFYNCSALTSITIPNSVTSIGMNAFSHCSSLTSITIPNSVTEVGGGVFNGCTKLSNVILSENMTCLMSSSFKDSHNLTISVGFFENCSSLTSITIPNSVTSIGSSAFSGCSALTSITIHNSVTSIESCAFYGCSSLTSITIPNSVTSIGGSAFRNCSELTSVTIPNSVTSIEDMAFAGCLVARDNFINYSNLDAWEHNYWGCRILDEEINGLLIQNNEVIKCRHNVTSVIIPNSITGIGNIAFYGCTSLTSMTIPNSVTSIGDYSFNNCSSLTSLTIGNSVTSIGEYAFSGCNSLTSVTIPNSVTSIGEDAFSSCSSLTSIYWNAKNYTDLRSYSDAPFFAISSQITSFVFGDSVKYIPAYLCHGMNRLASITIGSNVQELADSVFYNCNRIDTILIKALTPPVLRENVFSSKAICEIPCVSLHHYELSPWKEYAYSFETDPFNQSFVVQSNNDKMGVVDIVQGPDCGIPAIIKAVPAFGYHFVQWNDGNTDSIRTIFIDKDTCLVAEFALSYSGQCGENLYWSYDNSKLNINGSGTMNHFESTDKPWLLFNDSIITIDISLGATTIGKNAFANQIKLNTVILPYTLEDIGDKAFDGCRRLYNIYCYAAIPPIAELTSFMNYNAQLYIPCEALELYKSDMVFGEFDNLHCINADTQPVAPDTIIVTPGITDVTITWPTEDNAYQYVIEIKKDGEVFCTLTFNADGQLFNIAFAPGRNGNRPAQYAEQTTNGYRFTVTNLESGTKYGYNIEVKDDSNKTIKSHSSEFTTQSTTTVDNITTNNANIQKIIRDGQFIIVRDGVEYNAMGQEM